VVLTVVLAAGYICSIEVTNTGNKRVDVIGHKDGQGIIIELQCRGYHNSPIALTQLFTQGYYKTFRNSTDIKLCLAMGLHFTERWSKDSDISATARCLRDVEINEVLKELNIEKVDGTGTEIVTEDRIAMACAEKEGTNSEERINLFFKKAICSRT
jgi:hypothetical protein